MDADFYDQADPLLTAFDNVANSNSHLLKAPDKNGSLISRFLGFVTSEAFKNSMLESDLKRNWHNFHSIAENHEWAPQPGEFYNGQQVSFKKPLDTKQFNMKLRSLLDSGPSPHKTRYCCDQVSETVEKFLHFFPVDKEQVLPVGPTFLFSRQCFEPVPQIPENALCYFDGANSDHCWAWLSNGALLVLLLNGCP